MNTGEISRGSRGAARAGRDTQSSDFAGLVPFGAGVFLAVVIAQARFRPPQGVPEGTAAMAEAIESAVGAAPALWVALGAAFLGARWFLRGGGRGFLRDLCGIAGLALGLALIAGAFSEVAGGALGAYPRGLLGTAGMALGVLVGLAIAGGATWATWLRGSALLAWPTRRRTPSSARTREDRWGGRWSRTGGRAASGAGAVSGEEAEALLPPAAGVEREEEPELDEHDPFGPAPEDDPAAAQHDLERRVGFQPVSSPYPEDVRRKGEIPAGARPLTPPNSSSDDARPTPDPAPAPAADAARPIRRWTPAAPPAAGDPAGGDLARAGSGPGSPALDPAPAVEAGPREAAGPVRALDPNAPAPPLRPRPGVVPLGVLPVSRPNSPPRPSWERAAFVQEHLFEVEAQAQEAAIARALDPIHGEEQAATSELELAMSATSAVDELEAELEVELRYRDDDDAEEEETDEDDEDDEEEDEDEEDEDEVEDDADGADDGFEFDVEDALDGDDEEDEEYDEDEELEDGEEDEEELEPAAAPAFAASNDAPTFEDTSELDRELEALLGSAAERSTEPVTAAPERTPAAARRAPADFFPAARATEPSEKLAAAPLDLASLEAELAAGARARATEEFDADSAREAEVEESPAPLAPRRSRRARAAAEAAPAAEAEAGEREVILEPQRAPAGREKRPSELIVEAGCLFLDRERVAVSLLQRQFGLDFEASCAVLDELQERGLIGPYLGGQSREILMSRDQWLEAIGAG